MGEKSIEKKLFFYINNNRPLTSGLLCGMIIKTMNEIKPVMP